MSDDTERRPVGPASTSGGYDEAGQPWGTQAIADVADDEMKPGVGRLWRLLNSGD